MPPSTKRKADTTLEEELRQRDKAELLDILLTLIGDSGDFSDRIENLVAVRRPK